MNIHSQMYAYSIYAKWENIYPHLPNTVIQIDEQEDVIGGMFVSPTPHPNAYVEALPLNVLVFGGGAFER